MNLIQNAPGLPASPLKRATTLEDLENLAAQAEFTMGDIRN